MRNGISGIQDRGISWHEASSLLYFGWLPASWWRKSEAEMATDVVRKATPTTQDSEATGQKH
jgi:hypothetical protein